MVFLTHAETQVLQTLAAYNCRISEKNGRTGVRARGYSVDSIFLLDRLESLDSISVSYTSVHRLALEKRIMLPRQLLAFAEQFSARIAEQSAARINDIYCSSESASSRIGSFHAVSCALMRSHALSCALMRSHAPSNGDAPARGGSTGQRVRKNKNLPQKRISGKMKMKMKDRCCKSEKNI